MSTRKIIDVKQNGEKVWPKGHAKATFMSDGSTVEDAINSIKVPSLDEYVTETELNNKGFLTEHQDLSEYAKKDELPSVEGLASQSWVSTEIARAQLEGEDVDLSGYATKEDIANFATKNELPSVDGLASTAYVDEAVAAIKIPSVEGFATETWVGEQGFLTEHQDITGKQDAIGDLEAIREGAAKGATALQEIPEGYATESWVDEQGFLTEHQDISHLASKDDIPSLDGYAKTSDIPSLDGYAKTEDLPNFEEFAKTEDIPSLDDYAKTEDIPSLDGYAKTSDIPSLDGYAKTEDIPSLEGYLKADDLGNISLEGYATEQYVNDQVSNIKVPSIEHLATKDELTEINFYDIHDNPILNTEDGKLLFVDEAGNIGLRLEQDNILYVKDVIAGDHVLSSKADKIDLNGLATEDYVNTKVANATPDVELAVEDVKVNGESVIINKVANIDLSGYAKTSDIPSLDGYAKTADIPTLNGYATETYVGEKIAEIEIPSLEGYATEQWVNNKNYATEYDLKNIDYSTINNVPVSEDETGELNVTDESGNIGMKVASEAVYAKDFIAGEHKLSEKVDKTYVDDSIVEAPTVKYVAQSLTPDQKLQARSNIGASDGTKSVVYLGGTTILINHMEPYVVYAAGGVYNSVTINGVVTNHDGVPLEYAEYTLVFQTGTNCTLQLPNTIYWANGVIPSIEDNTIYELSISFSKCAGVSTYRAVLIPFKRVS